MEPIATFQALVVTALALLPGAAYSWAYEQEAGRWGARAADRVFRYVGSSAVFVVLALPLLYQGYRTLVVRGLLVGGRALPWWSWVCPVLYIAVPFAVGRLVGVAVHRQRAWTRWVVGPAPAPRAWDHVFARAEVNGWVRLRMSDGTWVFGAWSRPDSGGATSYAAGYPEDQDLYLADTAEVDADGNAVPDHESPTGTRMRGIGVLVRWEEVTYAEFIPG